MIERIKKKKNKFLAALVVFAFLEGYCFVAGLSLLIPLLLVFYGFHLVLFKKADARRLLQLAFLLALITSVAHGMMEYSSFAPAYIPVTGVAMLTMLLYNDLQLSFSMSFMSAAVVSLVIGTDIDQLVTVFIGGLTAAYAVRGARTRGTIIVAGFFVGSVQVLAWWLSHPEWTADMYPFYLKPYFISGLLTAGIVMLTLKIFEIIFGELTNFSLLELSDSLNQPLLKRLAFEAPGTYHHSLIVSNLAGAAADEIGANALLTRVGAYYHDIGKLIKPDYYVENQMMTDNKHDDLEPSLSRLVILDHVKEGVEVAEKEKLNPRIIDFIRQHHGTSVIHFFYQRALESGDPNVVNEESYRYPGPKPQTREIAIVMMADAVEGATRSLEEHTPTRIADVVRKIVNNKFIDGQLDECSLTLREIELICESFSRTMNAMYHVRVKYPNPLPKSNGHNDQSPSDNGSFDHGRDPESR